MQNSEAPNSQEFQQKASGWLLQMITSLSGDHSEYFGKDVSSGMAENSEVYGPVMERMREVFVELARASGVPTLDQQFIEALYAPANFLAEDDSLEALFERYKKLKGADPARMKMMIKSFTELTKTISPQLNSHFRGDLIPSGVVSGFQGIVDAWASFVLR